jgi:hypothetical protein
MVHINSARCGEQYAEKIKTGWDAIIDEAGLGTAPWQAAGWPSMTLEQLQDVTGIITRIFRKRPQRPSARAEASNRRAPFHCGLSL